MSGPTQPWDHSADPRESTVDLPRLGPGELADFVRGVPALPPSDPKAPRSSEQQHPHAELPPSSRLPAEPEQRAYPSSRTAYSNGRSAAGSLADLRSRLARLPDGHPSSPYDDGGQRKPPPIRLKQLELGLPAPGRDVDGEHQDAPKPVRGEPQAVKAPLVAAEPPAPKPEPPAAEPEARETASEPAEDPAPNAEAQPSPLAAGPIGTADDEPAPFPESPRAEPAPFPESPRAEPAPFSESPRAKPAPFPESPRAEPADLDLRPFQAWQPPRLPGLEGLAARGGNGHGGNGNGSPRRAAGPDTVQHRTVQPESADLRELAERTLASRRAAEGRNVFGTYGASGLTPVIVRLAAHLPFGGLASGSQEHSLKSPDRFTAKLARLVARNPGRTAEELASAIGDAVRYAFAFEPADYIEGTWLVHRRLKAHGFELEIRRNRWESPEYKGIFTQWRDPAHDLAFEVQFHTTASWAVAQRMHDTYIKITDPATPPDERASLRARQVSAAASVTSPRNWADIADFRLEPR